MNHKIETNIRDRSSGRFLLTYLTHCTVAKPFSQSESSRDGWENTSDSSSVCPFSKLRKHGNFKADSFIFLLEQMTITSLQNILPFLPEWLGNTSTRFTNEPCIGKNIGITWKEDDVNICFKTPAKSQTWWSFRTIPSALRDLYFNSSSLDTGTTASIYSVSSTSDTGVSLPQRKQLVEQISTLKTMVECRFAMFTIQYDQFTKAWV